MFYPFMQIDYTHRILFLLKKRTDRNYSYDIYTEVEVVSNGSGYLIIHALFNNDQYEKIELPAGFVIRYIGFNKEDLNA